jgi:hypothetical protein
VSRRLLVSSLLLVAALAGCGDHSSSAGPAAPHTGHSTPIPSPSPSPVPKVGAVHTMTWRLPYPVARAAVIGTRRGSVILAGGLLTGDLSTDRAMRLDPMSGVEEALPPLAVPVHDTAGGLVAGVPTVVGGGNATEQSVVQAMVHGRWVGDGNLPTTRSDLGVVEWRRHAYVIGGYDGTSEPRTILRLSPRAAPRPVGSLLQGVRYAALARIHSDVYVLGGEVDGRELDTVQKVDLATGHTRAAGRLPIPLGHAMAASVGSRILLMGGRTSPSRQTDAMWWFDPATRRFHRAGHLPAALSDAAVAKYRDRVWLLGGETPAVTDRVVGVTLR